MLGCRSVRFLWFVLFVCGALVFGSERAEAEEALASWYGPGFYGNPTASGEIFDASAMTAAHKTLPFGTDLTVSYKGRTVPVTINDRGPYYGERELDLSEGAATALGLILPGVDYVDVLCADGGIYPNCAVVPPPIDPIVLPVVEPVPIGPSGVTDVVGVPTVAQDAPAVGGTYVVQPGQTLSGIAAQLGTPVDQLALQNGLTDAGLVFPGQTLVY